MAKPKGNPQMSFYDTRYLAADLLNPKKDALYITLRDNIAPLVKDEDYADMYSDLGRTPISPRVLILTMLLQFLENLPDRQTARNVVMRLDWKVILGLRVNDTGFHFSMLEVFRDRLEENARERAAFDALLSHLGELGLVQSGKKQRLDSTHVLGHLRKLSRLECLTESLRLALGEISALLGDEKYLALIPPLILEKYTDAADIHKLDEKGLGRSYREAGLHAFELLAILEAHPRAEELLALEEVKTLKTVFEQNFDVEGKEAPEPKEKLPKGTGKERIATPHEPDARYSEKRGTAWIGYKAQVVETAEKGAQDNPVVNFITDVEVVNAAEHDIESTQPAIERQESQGTKPAELYVDAAYVSGEQIAECRENGVDLVGPAAAPNKRGIEMPLEKFQLDFEKEKAVCPNGKTSVYWHEDQKGNTQIRFARADCAECPLRPNCTKNKGGRSLFLIPYYQELQKRRGEMQEEGFKERMKCRNAIEGTISELVRAHGLRRSRYRGPTRTRVQLIFSALAVNVKRLTKAIGLGLCPGVCPGAAISS